MCTDSLTIALVSAASSVVGALLTIWLTPRLQHHFWKYQRRDELRLAAINEFNRLAAEFLTGHISATAAGTNDTPADKWFTEFMAAGATIRALFSEAGFAAFKAVEVMIGSGPPGLGPRGNKTVDDFVKARDAALRSLYSEVVRIRK
jgi:hypothetical protein